MQNKITSFWIVMTVIGFFPLGVWASDADDDGMDDAYELFFGVTNTGDALIDYDDDGLTNLIEAALWTDPFVSDTDRDGFLDGMDSNALSRAVMLWGTPKFTSTNDYFYTGPIWWNQGSKTNGNWETNGWHVSAMDTSSDVRLNVDLQEGGPGCDVVLDLLLKDTSNAVLALDLYDTNDLLIVENLSSNLLTATGETNWMRLSIPLSTYTNAARISFHRINGEIHIFDTLLYVDIDGDGLDSDQEVQLGTSDTNQDSDSDGVFDYSETFIRLTDPADGQSVNTILYANSKIGNDSYNGYAPSYEGGSIGPKLHIQAALDEAVSGDFIELRGDATFDEDFLCAHGKQVTLRAIGDITIK